MAKPTKQLIPLNLTSGIDTKTDKFLSAKAELIENTTVNEKGTPRKRNGFTSLSKNIVGGGAITSSKFSFPYRDQKLIADENNIYRYQGVANEWEKISTLALNSVTIKKDISNSLGENDYINSTGFEENDNYEIIILNLIPSRDEIQVIVRESKTGVIVSRFAGDGGGAGFPRKGRVLNVNGVLVAVIYYSNGVLRAHYFNETTMAFVTNVLQSGVGPHFDCVSIGTDFVFIYTDVAGAVITLKVSDILAVITFTKILTASYSSYHNGGLALYFDGVNIHVAYKARNTAGAGSYNHYYQSMTIALVGIVAEYLIDLNIFGSMAGSTTILAYDIASDTVYYTFSTDSTASAPIKNISVVIGTATKTVLSSSFKSFIRSRYIKNGDKFYFAIENLMTSAFPTSGLDTNLILVDVYNMPVASFKINNTIQVESEYNYFSGFSSKGSAVFVIDRISAQKVTIDFSYEKAPNYIEFEKNTYLGGGSLFKYNGDELTEASFFDRPKISAIVDVGGGSFAAGNYDFICVFEYVEHNGNIIKSRPSVELSNIAMALNGKAQITVSCLNYTRVGGFVNIVLYRKLVADSVFRFAAYGQNSKNLDEIVFNDEGFDNSSQRALYTTGDVLSELKNDPIGAILDMGIYQNRMFMIDAERENFILFSKLYVSGEGVFFNSSLFMDVQYHNNRKNDFFKVVSGIDNKVIFFKDNSIFAMLGDGPDNAGDNNSFTEPESISTDTGCSHPRSIIETDLGIFFKSRKGIYLLKRNLTVEYVGSEVEAYNSLTILSAVMHDSKNFISFYTKEGRTLTYDYDLKQWSTSINQASNGAFLSESLLTFSKSDGSLEVENSTFDDDGVFISQKIKSGWIKTADIQGFMRVWRILILGTYKSDHKMKVSVAYDYSDYDFDTYEIEPEEDYNTTVKPDSDDFHSGINTGVYQWNIHLKRQKCEAIKITIEDLPGQTAINGESYSLSGVTLVAGVKRGNMKMTGGKRK